MDKVKFHRKCSTNKHSRLILASFSRLFHHIHKKNNYILQICTQRNKLPPGMFSKTLPIMDLFVVVDHPV